MFPWGIFYLTLYQINFIREVKNEMLLVREKDFDSLQEGKNDVMDILPIYTVLFVELGQRDAESINDSIIETEDIDLHILSSSNKYKFKLKFKSDQYLHLSRRFNDHGWNVLYDECMGISFRDIDMIFSI